SQFDYFLASVPPGRVCFFCSRAFSFVLSIGWNLPSSAFCKAGFVDRLGLFMVSQISWTSSVMYLFGFGVFLDCRIYFLY
ncbi:hypothetical protein STEG23_028204, partial [Scotinomys teguina]